MTGAKHNMLEQAVRSHNLANVSTVAFKADLANAISQPIKHGEGVNSRIFAVAQTPSVDFSIEISIETGRELDLIIDGEVIIFTSKLKQMKKFIPEVEIYLLIALESLEMREVLPF